MSSSFTYGLLRNMLFIFYVLFFLALIFNLIPCGCRTHYIISIFSYLLIHFVCRSVYGSSWWMFQVYFECGVGYSLLQMSIRSTCLTQVVFLLFFCLLILSTAERRVLKSPTLNVELSISPFSFVSFCFIFCVSLIYT